MQQSDAEKRDQWLVRFWRHVERNLGPFFQAWATTELTPVAASPRPRVAASP